MTKLRRWAAIGFLLAQGGACACGCAPEATDTQPQDTVQKPAWLQHVDMRVVRAGAAFEGNTEVFLELLNRSEEPVSIDKLDAEGAVVLEHEGGAIANIHPISVGVKKAIELLPGKVTTTSLLFEATSGAPRTLRFYDKEFAISR